MYDGIERGAVGFYADSVQPARDNSNFAAQSLDRTDERLVDDGVELKEIGRGSTQVSPFTGPGRDDASLPAAF
jgi:hypothetical protein